MVSKKFFYRLVTETSAAKKFNSQLLDLATRLSGDIKKSQYFPPFFLKYTKSLENCSCTFETLKYRFRDYYFARTINIHGEKCS